MRMVTVYGSKQLSGQEALAVRLQASASFMARNAERVSARASLRIYSPERASIEKAMLKVEKRIVEAFWVLARSTASPLPREARRNGLGYSMDKDDKWGTAVANGGWLNEEPRPGPPSAREIDAADEPMDWLMLLPRDEAEIVSAGARSKRGEVGRRVNWIRVRAQMPKYSSWASDRLRKAYYSGLRTLAGSVIA